MAVAGTKKMNVPFDEADLAGKVLTGWRQADGLYINHH
jgi:hypothetical protein